MSELDATAGSSGLDSLRIVAFGGSLRGDSLNRHLLNAAVLVLSEHCEVEVADVATLPLYNQDDDPGMGGGSPPEPVQRFSAAVARAHGLLVVSPEYNWGVPGFLKNAVDWISHPPRDSVLVGRPVLLMGASTGPAGTGRAQIAWRQTFLSTRTPVLVDALQVPFAHTRITRDGEPDARLAADIERLTGLLIEESRHARERQLPDRLRQPAEGPVAGVYHPIADGDLRRRRSI
jgi:chromate reductase, NAD(P)H dehydrogenase (quinone)